MGCTSVPYTRVPKSSKLFLDYLYQFERLGAFFSAPPFDPASPQTLAEQVQIPSPRRREMAEILERQNRRWGCPAATLENIQRLSEPGTVAVVTGQQAGLFSGPAFTLYKALTAIRLAEAFSEQGLQSVPVFWLATEDHDLEEVAQTALLDEDYHLVALRESGERPAPHSSVGDVHLTAAITQALKTLEELLPAGESRARLLEDLRESYHPGERWGEAFGRFMTRLFSRWGVILLDPLDDPVHRLSAPVYEQALRQAAELRQKLLARSSALVRAGYHTQVHVAEDSTLLFLTRQGNRTTLHQRDGRLFFDGSEKAGEKDLLKTLQDRPLDFSPNVLLRPLVQDVLLPTVAYVAGPSELAYYAQAQALYEGWRPMPVIFPRAGFTLVDRRVERWLEKYKLSVEDVWQGQEHLSRKIAAEGFSSGGAAGWSERYDQSEQDLTRLLERLRRDVEVLDPTLLDSLAHAEEKMRYQMERLRGKISRAALQRSDLLARHEEALLRYLMPRKDLQEREVGGLYFLGRSGYDLLDRLLAQIQVRSSDHQVFQT
jgi:bacillithiol synthase